MLPAEIEERKQTERNAMACRELLKRLQLFHGSGAIEPPEQHFVAAEPQIQPVAVATQEEEAIEAQPGRPWFSIASDLPPPIRVESIQRVVARHFHCTRLDLLSSRRTAAVVLPRQIAMYLAKKLTPRSLPDIARRFGGRDHTTALHAVRKIESMLSEPRTTLREAVDAITLELEQGCFE